MDPAQFRVGIWIKKNLSSQQPLKIIEKRLELINN